MPRELLSGNEAVARGAWEAGVAAGVGYPGTPSTETLENLVKMPGAYAEWAPNEKVALEVGAGVSLSGRRALVTMKHVGLNVAADPLFTLAYTGVEGGLVILVADDPGMHSSQNEQDTRNYGAFARVPVLEPSDSTEALEFTKLAFEISERFDTPVIVRSTTRVSHSKSLVETGGAREERETGEYAGKAAKYVMMPGNARARRVELDRRVGQIAAWAEEWAGIREVHGDSSLGILVSGAGFQYVREALPEASVLKLGMTFPLPEERIRAFAASVERLAVVEEADTYLKTRVRALGIAVEDVALPPRGELSVGAVAAVFGAAAPEMREPFGDLPARPPLMCPGCPHRGLFHVLRKLKAIVMGDIGCYTLASLPPLTAMDTCVCMGASIGMAHGMTLAGAEHGRPVVGVIGDSTFSHSGITGLLDLAYNKGTATVVVLDNRITAMTGHQDNPMTGRTLAGEPTVELDLPAMCAAFGITDVRTVDPHDLTGTEAAFRERFAAEGPGVVISRAPCALLVRDKKQPYAVDAELCTACGACIKLGCPAISRGEDSKAEIDVSLCVGCRQCVQVCRYDAIVEAGEACEVRGSR
ncbi:MAG: indolepyruvate ferredoxin oxidoreductase subunit alpha [Actinobacteria bacterium]|nr:MAG: indolepyruvate ferredoxin oxidoreductase subunit alpha [Actinomycetota bacterium]